MIHTRPSQARGGYTLTVVLISIMLLFGLWTFSIRTTSGLLRIETTRSARQARDQGAMNAMAQALQLLQYGYPSDPDSPTSTQFTYYVTLSIPGVVSSVPGNSSVIPGASPITGTSTAQVSYAIVYTLLDQGTQTWQVQVTPASSVDPTKMLPSSIPPAWPAGAGQE